MLRGWSLTGLARRSPWPEWIFLILAAAYVVSLLIVSVLTHTEMLLQQFPWAGKFCYLLLTPAVACWIALHRRRLYLAWPFIFLGILSFAPAPAPADRLIQLYQLGAMALLTLLLGLGEVAGLGLGRWAGRPWAVAFFVVAAGLLLGLAGSGPYLPGGFPWQVGTLGLAGALYFFQALVQLAQGAAPEEPVDERQAMPSAPEEPSI